MAAPAARVPPAQDEACPAEAAAGETKRRREQVLGTDTDGYEMLHEEEIGEGTAAAKRIRGEGDEDDGHPAAIAQIKSVATDEATGGDTFVVTELAVPGSLRTRLTGRRFSEDETRDSMRQLLRAAAELHAAGTAAHRGISPDSVLVGPDGALKIRGSSGRRATPAEKTCPEEEEGTLQYRSPEQLIGSLWHGPEVDAWALGCVMAELLSGAPLFTAATEDDMITQAVDLHDEIVTMGVEAFDGMVDDLSLAGREVLAGLLAFHSEERLTAAEALEHRWFTEEEDVDTKPLTATVEAEHPGSVPCFSEA